MKTLEQIKNDYAVSKNFTDWNDVVYDLGYNRPSRLLQIIDEVMKIYAMECLKLASKNANLKKYNSDKFGHKYSDGIVDGVSLHDRSLYEVNKESITNENNIIK